MTNDNMPSTHLIYNGSAIRDRGETLNLTDMWRAAGSPGNQRPADWLRLPQTERRIRHLEATEKVGKSHLIRSTRGRGGETLAHWKLALEYAEDLSDEFWSWAKDAIRDRMVGKAASDSGEQIRRTDGIARMLAHKVTGLERTVAELNGRVNGLLVANDSRVAALDLIGVRQLLDEAGALSKGRNSLNGRVRNALLALADAGKVEGLRRHAHTNHWLFPIDFAKTFMKQTGNGWVAAHNAGLAPQGDLFAAQPKTRRKPANDSAQPAANTNRRQDRETV